MAKAGKKKKRAQPRVRDAQALQRRFYQGLDVDLLFNRARAIDYAIASHKQFSAYWKQHPAWPAEITDSGLRALALDLHFLEVHQSEVLFAMLYAPLQKLPHWLFLTSYDSGLLLEKIEQFAHGDWKALSRGRLMTSEAFVSATIYTGIHTGLASEPTLWAKNCANVVWLLTRIAGRHLENREDNNAYKHGLRVTPESNVSLVVAPDGAPSAARTLFSYEQGLAYLTSDRDSGDVSVVTKEINPNLSLNYLFVMRQILVTCRDTRLARLRGAEGCEVNTFLEIDRDGFVNATPASKFTITV